ncbi:tRNA threonylcarbamoyladenosine biosynthesis protein TsaE [Desulfonispora thiosulfatigenes DSM 11270]|uniref:tRNA threonylcarbamoyladenosine biosynthesis protein TsaE n=1 Tax=Desulfonispora thiosulfatigenes DSM 11270 TaxID=656914 RepID=A0A1W1V8V3_DESTI|nr:tRNA (adenosine(37)-N6)-threonylcarbamoyltransferase complex ATPase subunit type 1 TsaE [Desulfonispora thiosulfatigenes]SMB89715.1 tRNA threonylcarbamoyladenosine biosynthesis protein TsaE [Desulfonispora thiosulfatigenes DSM 11270]
MVSIVTKSPQETEYIGKRMAAFLTPGDIISLTGDLGAGKTLLVQGIAKGLGIEDIVTSPTFTIIQQYEEGRIPLYHMDVYRIKDPIEMEDIGYEEYFYGQGVTFVEWGNLIPELFPEEHLKIHITNIEDGREIDFEPVGRHYMDLVEELTGHAYTRIR